MNIENLRAIGKRLRQEISPLADKLRENMPIGKGAGGDLTYPIDKKAEDVVFEEVDKLDEPLTLISEEYGHKDIKGGGNILLIDPIDGSRNALSGVPFFSTSIALVKGDSISQTELGYVINLLTGDEFWAEKGGGAFFNGIPAQTQQDDACKIIAYEAQTPRIHVPAILPLLSLFNRTRCLGSIALDLALLSNGSVSVFSAPGPSRSFDFAAGYLLVKEAGGIITDLNGNDIGNVRIGLKKSSPLLASGNERLHRKALEALKL